MESIFFDVDGTLYDETDAKIQAELRTAEHVAMQAGLDFGVVYNAYYIAKWATINGDDKNPDRNNRTVWYQAMLRSLDIAGIDAADLSAKYWEVVKANIKPYYDVTVSLPILAAKYRLYIITDELLEICEEKLQVLGLHSYFRAIISSTHVGAVKPHKELFDYALKVTNSTADTSMMVGDHPARDILGGNRAGMATAWIRRGRYFYYQHTEEEKPDIIIENYVNFCKEVM